LDLRTIGPSSYILPEEVLAELLKLNIQKSSGLDGVRVHSTYANILKNIYKKVRKIVGIG
jgi:hypothetical protein